MKVYHLGDQFIQTVLNGRTWDFNIGAGYLKRSSSIIKLLWEIPDASSEAFCIKHFLEIVFVFIAIWFLYRDLWQVEPHPLISNWPSVTRIKTRTTASSVIFLYQTRVLACLYYQCYIGYLSRIPEIVHVLLLCQLPLCSK